MNETVFSFLRTGLIAAFLVLPCGASGTLAQAPDDRPTMVVAEVRNLTNSSQVSQLRLSENVQRDLESAIGATRRFRILERDTINLGTAFAEQELENSELSNSANARSGHVIAAGYIVVPSITRFELGASFTPLGRIDIQRIHIMALASWTKLRK
jgi:curli biogenesis system outer membrane secretion channel CsgG